MGLDHSEKQGSNTFMSPRELSPLLVPNNSMKATGLLLI